CRSGWSWRPTRGCRTPPSLLATSSTCRRPTSSSEGSWTVTGASGRCWRRSSPLCPSRWLWVLSSTIGRTVSTAASASSWAEGRRPPPSCSGSHRATGEPVTCPRATCHLPHSRARAGVSQHRGTLRQRLEDLWVERGCGRGSPSHPPRRCSASVSPPLATQGRAGSAPQSAPTEPGKNKRALLCPVKCDGAPRCAQLYGRSASVAFS
ncbi:hypothetical protein CIB84_017059, partial [Bambusicola thoracicus]